jgi:hypothetical protein
LAIFRRYPPRLIAHWRSLLPAKREGKHSSSGEREITQQQKNHQSRSLIGFCNLLLHRPSLACHRALWTNAIATAVIGPMTFEQHAMLAAPGWRATVVAAPNPLPVRTPA